MTIGNSKALAYHRSILEEMNEIGVTEWVRRNENDIELVTGIDRGAIHDFRIYGEEGRDVTVYVTPNSVVYKGSGIDEALPLPAKIEDELWDAVTEVANEY